MLPDGSWERGLISKGLRPGDGGARFCYFRGCNKKSYSHGRNNRYGDVKDERMMIWPSRYLIPAVLVLAMLLFAACGGTAVEGDGGRPIEKTAVAAGATVEQAPVEATPAPAEPTAAAGEEASPVAAEPTTAAGEEATTPRESPTAAAAAVPEAVEVPFFTPAQQEGPYYTVEKPADRDNDLVALAGATAPAAGEVLEFGGTVYDAGGYPLQGAVIEIWQTDAAGVYLHPNDPGTLDRDRNFQFYGEAQTDEQGMYAFRTILPGLYEPRPRHIHVKVRLDGQELLTTQFYFAGEIDLQGAEAMMLIDARPGEDEAGQAILIGERDIFLNVDGRG